MTPRDLWRLQVAEGARKRANLAWHVPNRWPDQDAEALGDAVDLLGTSPTPEYLVEVVSAGGVNSGLFQAMGKTLGGDLQGLMLMLSARARGAMESDLRGLAAALEDPDAVQFPVVPGATRVLLPDGRVLLLVWEDDGWHVEGLREGATPANR